MADATRLGVCGAAKEHGIPQSCVSRSASEKRKQPEKKKRRMGPVSIAALARASVTAIPPASPPERGPVPRRASRALA